MNRIVMANEDITIELLRECFDVDFLRGELTWKRRPVSHFSHEKGMNIFNTRYSGCVAGWLNVNGRLQVKLFGKDRQVHRVIYAMRHSLCLGDVPEFLDHRDGDPLNNNPDNLRPATLSQNACNSKLSASNTSGHKGVFLKRNKVWAAQIGIGRKYIHLGYFKRKEEAAAAYREAAIKHHGEFARF